MNQLSCILGKLSIQERSTDDASAYSLGRAVFELFVATDRLEDVLEAHPGLVRNLRWAMKRVTARTRNGAVKYGKKEGDSNNEDDNDQNKRLTLKRKMVRAILIRLFVISKNHLQFPDYVVRRQPQTIQEDVSSAQTHEKGRHRAAFLVDVHITTASRTTTNTKFEEVLHVQAPKVQSVHRRPHVHDMQEPQRDHEDIQGGSEREVRSCHRGQDQDWVRSRSQAA
jgi:hypothetical protein